MLGVLHEDRRGNGRRESLLALDSGGCRQNSQTVNFAERVVLGLWTW